MRCVRQVACDGTRICRMPGLLPTITNRATPAEFVIVRFVSPLPVMTTRTPFTGLPASRTRTRTIVLLPTVSVRGVTVNAEQTLGGTNAPCTRVVADAVLVDGSCSCSLPLTTA